MAMVEYRYQHVITDDLLGCIRWFQNQFQLRDWEIKLDTSIVVPNDEFNLKEAEENVALVSFDKDTLKALIWCPLPRLSEDNNNPLEATIHELCHIMVEARMGGKKDIEDESLVRTISPMMYDLYCRTKRIKRAEKK